MKYNLSAHAKSLLLLTSVGFAPFTYAQIPPDAGDLMREVEPPLLPEIKKVPELPAELQPPVDLAGPSLPVQDFFFSGNSVFSTAELQKVVSTWLGKQLTLAELKYVTDKVAQHYRQAGYLARVYLPEQNVDNGSVSIVIVEARFGEVIVEGDVSRLQGNPGLVEGMLTRRQQNGELFRLNDLERATLLLSDVPGITANTVLRASEVAQQTDVVVSIEQQPLWVSTAVLDNYGSRSSGKERVVFSSSVDNPSQSGDNILINALLSKGNLYAKLGYYRPWGYDGLRVGANISHLIYELTEGFDVLNAKGDAATLAFQLDYPLMRQAQHNINLSGSLALREYSNEQLGVNTSDKSINAINAGINGNRVDGFYGGGINYYGASVVLGSLDLSGNQFNQAQDKAGPRTEGSYSKLSWNAARLQKLSEDFNLWLSVHGQFAGNKLDSSETMSLGGANGVRAYPALEASGDSGLLLTTELRFKLSGNYSLTAFYDHGSVSQKATVNQGSQSDSLSGFGVSVDWVVPEKTFSAKLSIAHRIGSNPLANPATGDDNDGTLDEYPVWLSISRQF